MWRTGPTRATIPANALMGIADRPYRKARMIAPAKIIRYIKGRLVTIIWRMRGVVIADRVVIEGPTPIVANHGSLTIGSRLLFRTSQLRSRIGTGPHGQLQIGERCFVNGGATLYANSAITLGDHCLIGEGVRIDDGNYHQVEEGIEPAIIPITLGRNVWVANNAIILPGVSLGDHSVVGAGAVVTKSFPARSLVAGNPARLVRELTASERFVRR